MTSQESANVELLRRGYRATITEGIEAIVEMVDPQFVVRTADELPEAGTYRGRDELRRLLQTLTEPFAEVVIEPEDFIEHADRVVVPLRIHGRGLESGIELDASVTHVWTIRDATPIRLDVFVERSEALKAAGITVSCPSLGLNLRS